MTATRTKQKRAISNILAAEDAVYEPLGRAAVTNPDLREAVDAFLALRSSQQVKYAVADLLQAFGDYLHERYTGEEV